MQAQTVPIKAIILIGLPGCGKTTCGKLLANYLGWDFLDTDQTIEQETGSTIAQIFQEAGEAYFRKLESELLDELLDQNLAPDNHIQIRYVIAAGGGMPVAQDNMAKLQKLGKVIFLMACTSCLAKRLQGQTHRPLLPSSSGADTKGLSEIAKCLDKLLQERRKTYEQAHFKIETTNLSQDEVVQKVLLNLDICS
ncbi:MAG: shikimate kinase [Candidatus Melainabacteria bacterium]|nr:shikimate kinase [Candidatus Melainabacteria bacterium]